MPRPTTVLIRRLGLSLVVALAAAPALSAAAAGAPAPDPVGVWPLAPPTEVVATFDPPDDPWGAGHRGVDLAGSPGQPVRAALPGQVAFAGRLAGRGVVVVDHGATRTTYEPVTASLTMGDPVAAGDRIGTLEVLGSHCAPAVCLHWGWLRGQTYLDPLRLVGAAPVRLLPLWRDRPVGTGLVGASGPAGARASRAGSYAGWRPMLSLAAGLMRGGVPAGRPVGGGPW